MLGPYQSVMRTLPDMFVLLLLTMLFALSNGAAAPAAEMLMFRVELETYYVVDGRPKLFGSLEIGSPKRFHAALSQPPNRSIFHLRVKGLSHEGESWESTIPISDAVPANYAFALPIDQLSKGYNRLEVTLLPPGEVAAKTTSAGKYPPLGKGGTIVDFVILEKKQPVQKTRSHVAPEIYLNFVVRAVEQIIQHQSCRLGGKADGVRLITVGGKDAPPRRNLMRDADGKALRSEPIAVQGVGLSPEFHEPYGSDLAVWPLLDLLSEMTGDPGYAERVTRMAESFVRHGFDPRSGLGYLGEEAQLDVFRLKPVNRRRSVRPLYKHGPDLPMDRLWRHAPEKMSRMSKSMFYGLITDPQLMSYNRFCDYGFDDRARKAFLKPSERHGAFESAAGGLIQWWGSCFANTGDRECLAWAQKLADKWKAAQHPQSGLVPYTLPWKKKPSKPNTRGGAKFAVALLKAAGDFRKHPEGQVLTSQLSRMGLKLARGVARYGYDHQAAQFRESLRLDGTPLPAVTSRFFSTQTEKDRVLKLDPKARLVPVYSNGESFYLQGPYWRYTTGLRIPLDLATAAWLTKDPELIGRMKVFAEAVMKESRKLTSEFTPQGKWTFSGTGLYLQMMLRLHQATGEPRYLQWARSLANEEIDRLEEIAHPQWWRTFERNDFMEGLLKLYAAIKAEGR